MNTLYCATYWVTTVTELRAGNPNIGFSSCRPMTTSWTLPVPKRQTYHTLADHTCHRCPWLTSSRG
eukprot:6296080-Lingulodinium_polyedra.AAC.1